MKFACPESQKRESLKCGNIASVSALASVGGLGGSFAAGAVGAADCVGADCVESEGACDCAQPAGAPAPSTKASASARGSLALRTLPGPARRVMRKRVIRKMKGTVKTM